MCLLTSTARHDRGEFPPRTSIRHRTLANFPAPESRSPHSGEIARTRRRTRLKVRARIIINRAPIEGAKFSPSHPRSHQTRAQRWSPTSPATSTARPRCRSGPRRRATRSSRRLARAPTTRRPPSESAELKEKERQRSKRRRETATAEQREKERQRSARRRNALTPRREANAGDEARDAAQGAQGGRDPPIPEAQGAGAAKAGGRARGRVRARNLRGGRRRRRRCEGRRLCGQGRCGAVQAHPPPRGR